jgi:hypothetical protein
MARQAQRFAARREVVVKGGMLLAAYDARRPTADLDALARSVASDPSGIVSLVSEIARLPLNDGVVYQTGTATSRISRDQDPPGPADFLVITGADGRFRCSRG